MTKDEIRSNKRSKTNETGNKKEKDLKIPSST